MGEWTILERLLEAAVQQHSTMIGRILLTVVVIFRILIVGIVGEKVYEDEQIMFICNTMQPGCNQACYDKAFPISHIRYWIFQIILVCTPSLCFITYSVHQSAKQRDRSYSFLHPHMGHGRHEGARKLRNINGILAHNPESGGKDEHHCLELKEMPNAHHEHSHGKLAKGRPPEGISRFYVIQVVFRNALEIGFLAGQYFLYGFNVPGMFECDRYPCVKEVECYVSRPTEKTVFLVFMFAVSGICVLLNLAELNHLGWRKIKTAIRGVQARRKSISEVRKKDVSHLSQAPNLGRTQSRPTSGRWENLVVELGSAKGFFLLRSFSLPLILLTVAVILRMLIVGIVGEKVYEDEQLMFICNTRQPGCNQACYDKAFPISHIRYWVFQTLLVCMPSMCLLTYSVHQSAEQRDRGYSFLHHDMEHDHDLHEGGRKLRNIDGILDHNPESEGKEEDDDFLGWKEIPNVPHDYKRGKIVKAPNHEPISRFYVIQVVFRNALEIGFLAGQYFLYGFNVPGMFECNRYPCVKEVECYVSRPTEKTVFLVFMFVVSGICVLLNLAELNHLGWRKIKTAIRGMMARRKSIGEIHKMDVSLLSHTPKVGRTQSSESAYV